MKLQPSQEWLREYAHNNNCTIADARQAWEAMQRRTEGTETPIPAPDSEHMTPSQTAVYRLAIGLLKAAEAGGATAEVVSYDGNTFIMGVSRWRDEDVQVSVQINVTP